MTIDTTRTIEITGSRRRLLMLSLLGLAMTGLSVWVAWAGLAPTGSFPQLVVWIGVPFFGLCTAIALWRLATADRVVLTLSPDGIRDVRVAQEPIPWAAVTGLSTWSSHGQNVLVVAVDPEAEKRLTLTRMARWARGPNRALGADGLCIVAAGLSVTHDELIAAASAYAEAWSRGPT
ncbi:MAG: STM3941 family protein [Hyphomicrobiaceae bacterium]